MNFFVGPGSKPGSAATLSDRFSLFLSFPGAQTASGFASLPAMNYRILSPVLVLVLLLACNGEPESSHADRSAALEQALPGTWETVELEVSYPSYMDSDTLHEEFIREADWGRIYGVRPPSTVFTADGKLRRTYRMRSGQVANITNGIWRVNGDSLLVVEPNIKYTYAYELEGDRLQLSGVVDQDQDGAADDTFRAVYRLTGRTRQ